MPWTTRCNRSRVRAPTTSELAAQKRPGLGKHALVVGMGEGAIGYALCWYLQLPASARRLCLKDPLRKERAPSLSRLKVAGLWYASHK